MNLKKQKALRAKLDALAVPVESVMIGSTLAIFVGSNTKDEKVRQIKAGLAKGETVVEGGVTTWREWSVIHLDDDQYIWDASGDRIKGTLVEVVKRVDGSITRKTISTSFRTWDKAWG